MKNLKKILLTVMAIIVIIFVLLPLSLSLFDDSMSGNVALIKVEGIITGSGESYLGSSTVSSQTIVNFIKEAESNDQVKVILMEINSPGGSPVASDEIGEALKQAKKPTLALIREVGASGGYWVASATDHIFANRMSMTGSIGVISSYLEFSEMMDEYGVGYEQIISGKYKDLGIPYKKLSAEEKAIFQKKSDLIYDYFVQEIAENRDLDESYVRGLATGEAYLGIEALNFGLIDQLGGRDAVEIYIKENYGLEKIDYLVYQKELSFLEIISGVVDDFSFNLGSGMGAMFLKEKDNGLMLR